MTSSLYSTFDAPVSSGESDSREQAREQLLEAIEALVDAGLHAGFDHRVAVLDALEHRVPAQDGPTVALLEGHRVERDVAGRALELEGLDHRVGSRRAVEDAVEGVFGAVLLAVDVPPRAAVANVEPVDDHREPARAQPLHEEVRVRECSVDQIAR